MISFEPRVGKAQTGLTSGGFAVIIPIIIDNSIVTMGEARFETWISYLETLGGVNQLSYKTLGFYFFVIQYKKSVLL